MKQNERWLFVHKVTGERRIEEAETPFEAEVKFRNGWGKNDWRDWGEVQPYIPPEKVKNETSN